MRSNVERYGFVSLLLHWLLALATFALLGLGWYLRSSPTTTDERAFLSDLHVSLGLTTAIVIALAILARLFRKPPRYPLEVPRVRRVIGALLNLLIYFVLLVVAVSGYLRLVFAGAAASFWGWPLPAWGEPDDRLAALLASAHGIAAITLAALVVIHIGVVIASGFAAPGFASRMLPGKSAPTDAPVSIMRMSGPVGGSLGAKIGHDLAARMRLWGWVGFWIQFVFAFISALLLQFATAGRALSSLSLGFGDAIHWGAFALAILLVTCALAFYYTRRAKKVELMPDRFLSKTGGRSFWFLSAGSALSLVGLLLSFTGVALNITLLIAKTVSQPPGIAITDPSKIVRALDVFVLLMCFMLMMAHFIGVGIGVWLQASVAKARNRYGVASALAGPSSPPTVI